MPYGAPAPDSGRQGLYRYRAQSFQRVLSPENIIIDPDQVSVARALSCLDPDQVRAGGYCTDICEDYWKNLVDEAVYKVNSVYHGILIISADR
jgi:hypothetical protein